MPEVPRIDLAPGYRIARLIKGGWQLAGGHGVVDRASALRDMAAFVAAGITTFDCADIYTGVEALIGEFLSGNPGAGLQVHTKYVPDLAELSALTPAAIERSVDRSRARLRRDRLDVVQLHWWDYGAGDFQRAGRELARLVGIGKLRHVGVTNFGTRQLRSLVQGGVPVVSHQVQYSLLDRRPAGPMSRLCQDHGIGLLCYGSLAGGFLGERWLGAPEPQSPLENRSLVKYKLIIDEFGGWARFQELLRVLHAIAEAHTVAIGSVAIRWVLEQPAVAAAIIGARNTSHLDDTVAAFGFELTAADRARIEALLAQAKGPVGDVYELERDREGPHGRIMRYSLNAGALGPRSS
ncbi:MAG: aldo/keto reductase [Gemmatimonadaceae bacterium]